MDTGRPQHDVRSELPRYLLQPGQRMSGFTLAETIGLYRKRKAALRGAAKEARSAAQTLDAVRATHHSFDSNTSSITSL